MKVPKIHSKNTEIDEEKHRLCRKSEKINGYLYDRKYPRDLKPASGMLLIFGWIAQRNKTSRWVILRLFYFNLGSLS